MSFNEKRSYTEYNVTTSTDVFAIGFDDYNLESRDRIIVTIDDVEATEAGYTVTRSSPSTLTLNPPVTSGVVRLTRETNIDQTFNKFTAGSLFTPKNVNDNFEQILRSQQEVEDRQTKLEGDVFPVVGGLEDALAAAAANAEAAEIAANAAAAAAESSEFFGSNYGRGIRPLWKLELVPYTKGAEVRLDNGDIVRSIIDGNTSDPNVDTVNWFKTNATTQIFDSTGKTQDQINTEVVASLAEKAEKASTLAEYGINDAYTKAQVDSTVGAIANGSKSYQTLAIAQAAATGGSIPVNSSVYVTNDPTPSNNYLYTYDGTTLTKSVYDPVAIAEQYTDTLLVNLSSELSDFLPPPDQDFGYVNITTAGEVDFVKKLYVSGTWSEGTIFLDYLQKQSNGTQFSLYFRNASNGVIAGNNAINESDFTGVKTYIVNNDSAVNVAGFSVKIQIDWSKYNALGGGISKNRYVKNIAKSDFTSTSTNYQKKQDEQDARLTEQASILATTKTDLSKYLPPTLQDFGYVNITTAGEVDFVKKLYVASNPAWSAGSVYLDYLQKQSNGTQFAIYFRNASNTILLGNNVNETDYTGVKTYTIPAYGSTGYTGKIQIDWSKYNPIGSGISKNRYVKEAARIDFTTGSAKSIDDTHEDEQDTRLTNLENSLIAQPLIYKRFVNQSITTTDFQTNGSGWTLSGGIAVCNEVSDTTKLYAKQKYISNKIEHKWTLQLKANSVIKLGGFVGATYIETTCVIDCVNKKLIINRAGDNSAAATTPRASVTIPFNIVDDREYYVVLHRNNRKNSIKLVDSVTAQSVTATDDWSSVGYTIGSGNMRSYPYITLSAGTSITVKKYENYLPFGVDVVFGGDSNTESSQDVSGVYQVNWADNLMTSVFKENGVKFAEFGIGFSGWWSCINEVIAMKPKYFIVNIGTNGATSQANYQQIVDMCAANNIELILCHNPRDDGSRTYLAQNNLNIDATGVRTVKFDVATSLNNDLAQAYNSAYYKDGVHLNTAGYKVLSDRFLAEIPMLKSN